MLAPSSLRTAAPRPERIRRSIELGALAAALAFGSLACTASAEHMRPGTAAAIGSDPAAATVVFVRPSSFAGLIVPVIATAQGRFLGESEASSHFVVRLPPGEHVLFTWSEGTPALRATLAAGRVYFVEVAPKMGAFSSRVQLLALTSRAESWPKVREWLRDTKTLVPDEAAGQAYVQSRASDFAERIAAASVSLREYSPDDLAARTLLAADGITMSADAALGPSPTAGAARPDVAAPAAAPAPASPSATAPPSAAPRPDQVLMKGGGRVRGTVMVEDPSGVSIRLLDGSSRKIPRAEIDRVELGSP